MGTGRYPTLEIMQECHRVAETQMVTVALRRIELNADSRSASLIDHVDTKSITLLPNTAGTAFAADTLRLARIGEKGDVVRAGGL